MQSMLIWKLRSYSYVIDGESSDSITEADICSLEEGVCEFWRLFFLVYLIWWFHTYMCKCVPFTFLIVCACTWVLGMWVHLRVVPGLWCAEGSFDAFLSGPARFALFVFNDASREADSRRVERTAFDVSDYDITDVQSRRAEEWGSVLSFFFLLLPSGILFRERREGGTETHWTWGGGEIKYLAKTRILCSQNKRCQLIFFDFVAFCQNFCGTSQTAFCKMKSLTFLKGMHFNHFMSVLDWNEIMLFWSNLNIIIMCYLSSCCVWPSAATSSNFSLIYMNFT